MKYLKSYILLALIFAMPILVFGKQGGSSKGYYVPKDTGIHSIKDFFKKSHLHGHARNYFMATVNDGDLYDYWTNAMGGAIGFESPIYHGFQMGVQGIFTFQTFSSDLNKVDSTVMKSANWEKELYDIHRPYVKSDLDRLEAFYLKFHFGNSFLSYGKMNINKGPLLLSRDGRMKPFVYRGFWSEIREVKDNAFTLGWIHGVSSRGTTEWVSINEAIGSLNNGYLPDDSKAKYHESAHTKGIGVFGVENESIENFKVQYWGYFFHHLFFMNWVQMDYERKNWFSGVQFVLQTPTKKQGELSYEKRYMQPDEKGIVLNPMFGVQTTDKQVKLSVAYLRSFDKGRFLFPRELGRENFYVSQPRSWVDGFGNTNMYMLRVTYQPAKKGWHNFVLDTRLNYVDDPGLNNLRFNKYNVINYYQATVDIRYKFTKWLKGLEMQLLYIARYTPDTDNADPVDIFYRTNFHHINFITNIKF